MLGIDKKITTSGKNKCSIKQFWNNITAKTGLKCIGKTLAILKMDSKALKTCVESSYTILNITQSTRFSSACRPAIRHGSTNAKAPDFCEDHYIESLDSRICCSEED